MDIKVCRKCGEEKPLDEFHNDRTGKYGKKGTCKICCNTARMDYHRTEAGRKKRKEYYEKNREAILAYKSEWQHNNRDKAREYARKNRKNNPEKEKQRLSRYRLANLPKLAAKRAKQHARKLQATPPWVEEDKIKIIYEKCAELNKLWGTNFEVDHFIPLQGKDVSGLHCWDNLQLLDSSLNRSKQNRNPLCPTHS